MTQYFKDPEERAIDALARSLAEFDGYIIVEGHTPDEWEPGFNVDRPLPRAHRNNYVKEARRALHIWGILDRMKALRQI